MIKYEDLKMQKKDRSGNAACLHNNNLFTYFLLHTIYDIIIIIAAVLEHFRYSLPTFPHIGILYLLIIVRLHAC